MTTIDKSRRIEPSGPAIFQDGWIKRETAERTKDRVEAGWSVLVLVYVAIITTACFVITQGLMDILKVVCPACFGR